MLKNYISIRCDGCSLFMAEMAMRFYVCDRGAKTLFMFYMI